MRPGFPDTKFDRDVDHTGTDVKPAPPETSTAREAAPAGSHRQLFESRYRALAEDVRAQAAGTVADPDLSALCFDPLPVVIRGVLSNPHTGLIHVRLIAAHHANAIGLQAIATRHAFLQDPEVQRLLLRNIQTPDSMARNLFGSRRLSDIFKFTTSHDLPDRHRETARESLRRRYAIARPEERVDLLVMTEGRTLAAFPGLGLDGATVALLCARGPLSVALIENLARWPGTPPKLVAHLLKQPLLRQYPSLKQAVLRHPNCPSAT